MSHSQCGIATLLMVIQNIDLGEYAFCTGVEALLVYPGLCTSKKYFIIQISSLPAVA